MDTTLTLNTETIETVHFEEKTAPSIAPIGHITEIHGPVVDIACETLPPLHRALIVTIEGNSTMLEVLHHHDPHQVRAIALGVL